MAMPKVIDWSNMKLLPKQRLFFESKARYICYGGARGGGKSWAMRMNAVRLCLLFQGLRVLLLRRTLVELRENHLVPLMKDLSGIATWTDVSKAFTFPNGSIIKLGYCDAEKDVFQYQGQEYDVVCLEEATHFTEMQFMFLTTCNRTTRTDFAPRMYLTCNPGNIGHAWVKRLFISRKYTEREKPEDYEFIAASAYDNPFLNDGYVDTLKALPDDLRRAHLEGDWNVMEGQFFTEFKDAVHVVKPFKIPEWWRKWRSMDYGYNDPACILWHALDGDGHVYTYREVYEKEKTAGQLAEIIKKATPAHEKIMYTVASPDMWQRRGMSSNYGMVGDSPATYLQCSGVPCVQADTNRVFGWLRIREYMQPMADGKPKWRVFRNCQNLIRTLPEMIYDPNNAEDIYYKCEDHAAEALRYGLYGPRGESQKPIDEQRINVFNPLADIPAAANSFFRL